MAQKLPYSLDAEKSVLGAVFLDGSKISQISAEIREEDFFDKSHVMIFQAMKDLFHDRKNIDYSTLSAYLGHKGQLETIGGIIYLIELSNYTVSLEHLDSYMNIVRDFSLKREVINVTQGLATDGLTTEIEPMAYLDKVEQQVLKLSQKRRSGSFKEVPEIIKEVRDKMHFLQQNKGKITGLTSGFSNLDSFTNGLQPEELIIIAARPAMGKSAFAMNLAVNVARNNKNGQAGVAVFSLEMSNDQLAMRMISSLSNIENSKLRTGFLTPQEWKQFEYYTDELGKTKLFFDDSATSGIADIRAKCRMLAQKGELDLVVIDYLQLIKDESLKTANRQEEVSRISRSLKQMAKELKIPVIALSQLSRDVEKTEDKRPMLSHLRESGSIEQDADIVMFIHREEYYSKEKSDQAGDAEVIIAKNRSGRVGNIKFVFSGSHSRFQEQSFLDEPNN